MILLSTFCYFNFQGQNDREAGEEKGRYEGIGFETDLRGTPMARGPFTELARMVDEGKIFGLSTTMSLFNMSMTLGLAIGPPLAGCIADTTARPLDRSTLWASAKNPARSRRCSRTSPLTTRSNVSLGRGSGS